MQLLNHAIKTRHTVLYNAKFSCTHVHVHEPAMFTSNQANAVMYDMVWNIGFLTEWQYSLKGQVH